MDEIELLPPPIDEKDDVHVGRAQLKRLRAHLDAIELRMEVGMAIWYVGLALIRRTRAYRARYDNFQDYAVERWCLSRRRVDQLAAAGDVLLELDPGLGTIGSESARADSWIPEQMQISERRLRPLVTLKDRGYSTDELKECFAQVISGAGKRPSGKKVSEEADKYVANSLEGGEDGGGGGGDGARHIRLEIEEACYGIVRKLARCDRIATRIRAVVAEELLRIADEGTSILLPSSDHRFATEQALISDSQRRLARRRWDKAKEKKNEASV